MKNVSPYFALAATICAGISTYMTLTREKPPEFCQTLQAITAGRLEALKQSLNKLEFKELANDDAEMERQMVNATHVAYVANRSKDLMQSFVAYARDGQCRDYSLFVEKSAEINKALSHANDAAQEDMARIERDLTKRPRGFKYENL